MSEAPPPSVDSPSTDADPVDEGTTRDRVWDATLTLLADRPLPFQAWRIRKRAGLDDSHDRTIRRTLSVMAEVGWLTHEPGSKWWYPGEKAKQRFEVEFLG
jgi:hypothetical protein